MYLLYQHVDIGLRDIGLMFKEEYDHTTVRNARITIKNLIDTGCISDDYRNIISEL
jgi:chromosomal replication initiation ATPase DnaA